MGRPMDSLSERMRLWHGHARVQRSHSMRVPTQSLLEVSVSAMFVRAHSPHAKPEIRTSASRTYVRRGQQGS